jgi:hypothetical protein
MYTCMHVCVLVLMYVMYEMYICMYICYLCMLSLYVNAAYVHSCTYVCMYACLFMHARKEHGCISSMVVCVKHVCMCICSQTEYVMYNTVCTSKYMCIHQICLVPYYYVYVCMQHAYSGRYVCKHVCMCMCA